jgi:WhiB family redox-sensing transcriptional regulator
LAGYHVGYLGGVEASTTEQSGVRDVADTRRLPVPITEIWDWQMHGACRGMDSAYFFHPEGERGPARANREARAKEVCRRCPVLEPCRRHALSAQEPYGVWGGLSESERDDIIRGHDRTLRMAGVRPRVRDLST